MSATVEEHAALVRALIEPVLPHETETVPLADAAGRVLGGIILSPVDLPLFRNSQMDGFAIRAADLPGPLPIAGEIPARPEEPTPIAPSTGVRIMTGAVVPEGADAVVPVEEATVSGDQLTVRRPSVAGEYVRERGSDIRVGDELLAGGIRLSSRHLAALAAASITSVPVRRRTRVSIITTGAELMPLGIRPGPGQIVDANAIALHSAVIAAGAVVAFEARVTDNAVAFREALDAANTAADLVLTSGGISMGEHEVVRDVLEPLGGTIGQVAMQPGGPQATAAVDGVPVIAFPGNPVSTQLSFEVFVAPLLRAHAGLPAAHREVKLLAEPLRSVPGKRQFLRGRAVGSERVALVSGPGSHLVAGLAASDLLVVVPEQTTELAKGDTVETIAL
ncbi:molybdopterin molybdotransferase MoeA [soil metagenome]